MSLEKHISPYKKRIPLYKQIASLESEVARLRETLTAFLEEGHEPVKDGIGWVCNICVIASGKFENVRHHSWPCRYQIAKETLNPKDALKWENQT